MPPTTDHLLHLQTPRGGMAARARKVERYRLTFEVEAPLRPGDAADFELELDTVDDHGREQVRGTLRVVRIVDAHPGAPTLFSAEIVEVRREHVGVFEAWLRNEETRGARRFPATGRLGEARVDISDDSGGDDYRDDALGGGLGGLDDGSASLASEGDATDLLDSVVLPDRRRASRGSGRSSDSWGLTSGSASPALHLAGREAIRAALRHGLESRRDPSGRRVPRSAAWLDRARTDAASAAREWCPDGGIAPTSLDAPTTPPTPAPLPDAEERPVDVDALDVAPVSEEEPPAGRDPSIRIDPDARPVEVTVHWQTAATFRGAWRQHLARGGLFLETTDPLPSDRRLTLVLVLPDGTRLRCPGQVVAPMPTGCGLSLLLDDDARATLSAAAAAP